MYPILETLSINTSAVKDDETGAVVLVVDELAQLPDAPHGAIYDLRGDTVTELGFHEINLVGQCFSGPGKNQIVTLAEWGDVFVSDGETSTLEQVEVQFGPLRNLTQIGANAIACGADLQVFRRESTGWVSIGPDEALRADFPANHIEAIDGFGENELYGAGRDGVIWWFDGTAWYPVQSQTNLSFYAVHCGSDNKVYLSGQGGIVAVGRYGNFELHKPDTPLSDVWGVALWNGLVYLASFRAMITWDGSEWDTSAEAMAVGQTFYDLHISQSYLWSIGMKDVLKFDGETWVRINEVKVR